MSGLSRRQILRLSAAAGAGLGLGLAHVAVPAFAADEYDLLRQRWVEKFIVGSGYDPAVEPFATQLAAIGSTAQDWQSTMAPSASTLWPDLPVGSVSANVTSCFGRLNRMAQAWAMPGTGVTGDAGMLADVITGLDWMNNNAYTSSTVRYDNSWDFVIGSPKLLLDIMAMVYASLSGSQVAAYVAAIDHFVPVVPAKSTGANRVDYCQIFVLRGIVHKDSARLVEGRDGLSPVFPLVRDGDGFYADGSFIQHGNVPYVGTYGQVLVGGLSVLLALLHGSSWEVTDPARQVLFDAVTNAIAPFIFNGLMMDSQSGRAISRGLRAFDNPLGMQQDDHKRGHVLIANILTLAESAPAAQAEQWKAIAKGWLQRDYWSPFMDNAALSAGLLARGKAILDDTSITPATEPVESRVFGMDRAVHRRPTWAYQIAMCSQRTAFYETGNGENLRGWHTNSGMTYWWGATYGNGQYSDAYWPTVDPYRLPGTTVSRKPLADAEGGSFGLQAPAGVLFAGGATDGVYSAVGQDTRGLSSTLNAKKSWFCLDDQVVCLGAGITASDGHTVETTIENRNLGGTGTTPFSVDGVEQPTTVGWSDTFTGASWALMHGWGGYVFPGRATFNALREARTGAWSDINTRSSTAELTRYFLTLWFNHGTDPSVGSYSYIHLPGANAQTTSARAANPTVTILSNTANVQAIKDTASGVTAANFFTAGSVGPITVSAPCSVLMRENGGTLSVSVADPTRAATTITVTIDRSGFTTASGDHRIAVTGLDPITLVVETGGGQGASRTVTFGTGSAVAIGRALTLAPAADAFVRDGNYADVNYGTHHELHVKTVSPSFNRQAFLKFDLSGLAGEPRRAVLWVYGFTSDSGGTQTGFDAHAGYGDSWTESGVTWNNQPALSSRLASGRSGGVKDWIPLNVTSHVKGQYAGDRTVTLGLAQPNTGLAVVLHSRNAADHRPFLQVITD